MHSKCGAQHADTELSNQVLSESVIKDNHLIVSIVTCIRVKCLLLSGAYRRSGHYKFIEVPHTFWIAKCKFDPSGCCRQLLEISNVIHRSIVTFFHRDATCSLLLLLRGPSTVCLINNVNQLLYLQCVEANIPRPPAAAEPYEAEVYRNV